MTDSLHRCCDLAVSSISSFRRLRRICCRLRSRLVRSEEQAGRWQAQAHQFRREAEASEAAREALDKSREELARRTQEVILHTLVRLGTYWDSFSIFVIQLQDAQVKLNDNYKLMAEMSNENLRLAGEKIRAEERLGQARGGKASATATGQYKASFRQTSQ